MCGALTKAMRCLKKIKIELALVDNAPTITLFHAFMNFFKLLNSLNFCEFLKLAIIVENINKKKVTFQQLSQKLILRHLISFIRAPHI